MRYQVMRTIRTMVEAEDPKGALTAAESVPIEDHEVLNVNVVVDLSGNPPA